MSSMSNKFKEMHEEDWIEDLNTESPILPSDIKELKENKYSSRGWKFYLRIKPHLSDLWYEFNTKLNTKGNGPKYKRVRYFAEAKFKKDEKYLFYLMTCSQREWEACASENDSIRKSVPWLGDWDKRRKNGYWSEDNGYQVRQLQKVLKENLNSTEAIKATAPYLIQQMTRYARLQAKVDEAFGGEPFEDGKVTSRSNKERFKTYVEMSSKVTYLINKLIQQWMVIHGVNPHEPSQMWSLAQIAQLSGQMGAAGALTGIAAAQQGLIMQGTDGQTVLNRDALLLADQLTNHKNTFNNLKPESKEPIIIEAREARESKSEKINGKSNGKNTTQ